LIISFDKIDNLGRAKGYFYCMACHVKGAEESNMATGETIWLCIPLEEPRSRLHLYDLKIVQWCL